MGQSLNITFFLKYIKYKKINKAYKMYYVSNNN